MGHARAVATAPDPEELAKEVIAKGLSVRQTEELVRRRGPRQPFEGDEQRRDREVGQAFDHEGAEDMDGGRGDAVQHEESD